MLTAYHRDSGLKCHVIPHFEWSCFEICPQNPFFGKSSSNRIRSLLSFSLFSKQNGNYICWCQIFQNTDFEVWVQNIFMQNASCKIQNLAENSGRYRQKQSKSQADLNVFATQNCMKNEHTGIRFFQFPQSTIFWKCRNDWIQRKSCWNFLTFEYFFKNHQNLASRSVFL